MRELLSSKHNWNGSSENLETEEKISPNTMRSKSNRRKGEGNLTQSQELFKEIFENGDVNHRNLKSSRRDRKNKRNFEVCNVEKIDKENM